MQSDSPARLSRRALLSTVLSTTAATTISLFAALAAEGKNSLTGEYAQDAAAVLAAMREACDMARGTPGMANTIAKTRREMNDFVAFYRRNEKVAACNLR